MFNVQCSFLNNIYGYIDHIMEDEGVEFYAILKKSTKADQHREQLQTNLRKKGEGDVKAKKSKNYKR